MDRASTSAPSEPTPTHGLILVAEDNPINQLFLQRQLLRFGHVADLVSDGAEALAAYANGHYRLMLTDCHMPNMDGFALTHAIRGMERGMDRRMAIVAIAANTFQREADRCIAAGMDDILFKPVGIAMIGAMLDRWLSADAVFTAASEPERKPAPTTEIASGNRRDGEASDSPIDMAMLSQLLGTDDDAYLNRMIGVYWSTVRNTPAELTSLITANDASNLRDAAHAAKGASSSVGAVALSSLLKDLQVAAADADWERIAELMPRIDSGFKDLERFIGTLRTT